MRFRVINRQEMRRNIKNTRRLHCIFHRTNCKKVSQKFTKSISFQFGHPVNIFGQVPTYRTEQDSCRVANQPAGNEGHARMQSNSHLLYLEHPTMKSKHTRTWPLSPRGEGRGSQDEKFTGFMANERSTNVAPWLADKLIGEMSCGGT